jgi:hypothetical protein
MLQKDINLFEASFFFGLSGKQTPGFLFLECRLEFVKYQFNILIAAV